MVKIKNILISVYDKTGLTPVLNCLKKHKVNIYSTGGTYSFIKKKGFSVRKIEGLTNFPEILNGRVKTLHPKVFGGVLADMSKPVHKNDLKKNKLIKFDALIINLYPFFKVKKTTKEDKAVELIDIGGMALLRSGAKNFSNVCALSSKSNYASFIKELNKNKGSVSTHFSKKRAREVFKEAFNYDFNIYNYFSSFNAENISLENKTKLRYGENPHQNAFVFYDKKVKQLQGKEISYNNILDMDSAASAAFDFKERVCVIVKHTSPCGCAFSPFPEEAFLKAWAGDPKSAFGSVIAFNKKLNAPAAEKIIKNFVEAVIAPGYDKKALLIFKNKPALRVIEFDLKTAGKMNLRSTLFGTLYQSNDNKLIQNLKKACGKKTSLKTKEDMLFAYKIVKHLKSNAVCFVKNKQLLGMGAGQVSRVDAVKNALKKAEENKFNLKGAVLASDAFFPFADNIELLKDLKLSAVIQPGGSVRDKEVIDACVKYKIPMYFTGLRHFKH